MYEKTPEAQAVDQDSILSVYQRLSWYKKTTHLAIWTAIGASVTALALALICAGLFVTRPTPEYFAVTPQMRIKHLTPLSSPVMSTSGLLNWASQALTSTLSLDFVHWRDQLKSSESDYTHKAFSSLLQSLQNSGDLKYIRKNRLSVSVNATQAPVLLNKGMLGKHLAWRIQVPLKMTYESSNGTANTESLVATMIVERVKTIHRPRGVAIAQVVLHHNQNPGS